MEFVFEDVAEALADDPACTGFLQSDAALLLWDGSAERLLWSSPSAAWLREAFAVNGEGRPDPALPALERLRALGGGLVPRRGIRLELLWFDADRSAPPVTCACRIVALPSGEDALLTAPVGSALKPASRPSLGRPKSAEKASDAALDDSAVAQSHANEHPNAPSGTGSMMRRLACAAAPSGSRGRLTRRRGSPPCRPFWVKSSVQRAPPSSGEPGRNSRTIA